MTLLDTLQMAVLCLAAAFVWLALAIIVLACIAAFSALLQEKQYQNAVRRGVASPCGTNSVFSGLRELVSGLLHDARARRIRHREEQ